MSVADSLLGRQLGPYQIEREIGRGGMSVVYKAFDPRRKRDVALKVLPAYFQHNRQFLARFQREAAAAGRLRHANIVRIYDAGQADGYHCLAMEYADGGSLADELARHGRPLRLSRAVEIVRQVAAALDYAHSRDLVHRDLKPNNVLLTRDGRVLLCDFGIAKIFGQTTITDPGDLVGTPAYMAPEQALGRRDVDHRADVYALGVLLYEMLTGDVPFDGDTPLVVLRAIVDDAPRRPTQANPRIPPGIESVILRALQKDRQRRFQSAGDLASALQIARANPSVIVSTPQPAQPQKRPPAQAPPQAPTEAQGEKPFEKVPDRRQSPAPKQRAPAAPRSRGLARLLVMMAMAITLAAVAGLIILNFEPSSGSAPEIEIAPIRYVVGPIDTREGIAAYFGVALADVPSPLQEGQVLVLQTREFALLYSGVVRHIEQEAGTVRMDVDTGAGLWQVECGLGTEGLVVNGSAIPGVGDTVTILGFGAARDLTKVVAVDVLHGGDWRTWYYRRTASEAWVYSAFHQHLLDTRGIGRVGDQVLIRARWYRGQNTIQFDWTESDLFVLDGSYYASSLTPGERGPLGGGVVPTATRTPTARSSRTSTPPATYPAPILVGPDSQARFSSDQLAELQWAWGGRLGANEYFEVRMWRSGQGSRSIAWTDQTYYRLRADYLPPVLGEPERGDPYYWSVAVVRGRGGAVEAQLGPESTPRLFFWDPATPTPRPTRRISTPTPVAYPAPTLLAPADGVVISARDHVTLRWTWDGTLGPDEHFDVRVWRPGQEHLGVAWVEEPSYVLDITRLPRRLTDPDSTGAYYWSVVVVRGRSGSVERELSEESSTRVFYWGTASPAAHAAPSGPARRAFSISELKAPSTGPVSPKWPARPEVSNAPPASARMSNLTSLKSCVILCIVVDLRRPQVIGPNTPQACPAQGSARFRLPVLAQHAIIKSAPFQQEGTGWPQYHHS